AEHEGHGARASDPGPDGRWAGLRCASAVTGALLATRRDLFTTLDGFDETNFAISYNDIDYCLRVREAGKLVAYVPELRFLHHESKSRGRDGEDAVKRE